MKKYLISLFFAAAVFCAPAAARAEEAKTGISREQAGRIAELVTRPAREAVVPAINNVMTTVSAASWALWDLLNDLRNQQKAGKKPEPDLRLTETHIRLTMRASYGDLCLRPGAHCKAYPGDADFAKMAQAAGQEMKKYAAGLKGQSPLQLRHRNRLQSFMDTARKKAIFTLPMTRETAVKLPPETQEETKYLQMALEKKKGPKYAFPPWP